MSELPEGWAETTVGEIAVSIKYGHTTSAKAEPVGPRFLRITDIQDGNVDWASVPFGEVDDHRLEQYLLEEGDLVFARTGATTGKSFLINGEIPTSIFASYLIRLRLLGSLKPQFLYTFFQTPDYWRQIKETESGIGMPSVNGKKLAAISLPLPPENEQRRIVAKLEKCEERIGAARAALDQVPKLLEQYRQSVLAAAFRGDLTRDWRAANPEVEPATELLARLRTERRQRWEQAELAKYEAKGKAPPKNWQSKYKEPDPLTDSQITDLPELPEGWCWARLEELLSEMRNGISKKPTGSEGLSILRISAVRPAKVNLKDVRFLPDDAAYSPYQLESLDLLFTRYNGNANLVGVCGLVEKLEGKTIYPDKLIRGRLVSNESLSPSYIMHCLNAGEARKHIKSVSKTAAGQVGISGTDLKNAPVALAPISEQLEIANVLKSHFDLIASLKHSENESAWDLTTLTQSLLAKAFRGELVPQDPNDEPASELLARLRQQRATEAATKKKPKRKAAKKKRASL